MASDLPTSRRSFLKLTAMAGGSAAVGAFGLAIYEPFEIRVEQVTIRLRQLPSAFDGLRLVQISDIHYGDFTYEHYLRRAVETVNGLRPDLVVTTGDFVTAPTVHGWKRAYRTQAANKIWPSVPILREIRARYGHYAVLGNHDMASDPALVTEAISSAGINLLRDTSVPLEDGSARLWLAGFNDALHGRPDLDRTLRKVPRDECVIAAVHEPDFADTVAQTQIAFQISGHSHGGQVRFPLVGALYLPPMAQKYVMGYYRVGGLQLYTNRGLGVINLPVRFMCPPEITLFTLTSG